MRLRKLETWAFLLALALPAWAADRSGTISGYVRNSSGQPQMGAVVEIFGEAHHSLTVFTDVAGHFTATDLLPGLYSLKVSAPSFLPAFREKLGLRPGANLSLNLTLNTLLDVMQLGPARTLPDDDDWKWTLRSVANRPILRVFDDPPVRIFHDDPAVPADPAQEKQSRDLRGTLSFVAGSTASGYGAGSDMTTGFTLERSIFSDGLLAFSGNVGYGDGSPAGVLRTRYSHQLPDGSQPSLALTVRRFASSDPALRNAALQALAFSAGDDFALGDLVEVRFGSELQAIQFLGHVTAFRPYAAADIHLSPKTVLQYDYASSRPDLRAEKGFDSAPADMSEADPRVALLGFSPQVENAHHQELSVSRRQGDTNVQLAVFSDHVTNTVLTGAGEVTAAGGFLLPDISSGTFSYAGRNLDTNGLRLVLQRKVFDDLTATVDYAFGGVLNLTEPDASLQTAQSSINTERRHALGGKLSGNIHCTRTHWIASYRWVNGTALTPVDMFNASPGQSDPFLSLFVRQPIPTLGFLPAHMEAVIDLRNLLAQGYVPVLGQDGETVYLVQAARSVRGGLTFTF